jgi:hypothetical protein
MDVRYVELNTKDPNETGYPRMIDAISGANQITFFDLIQYKINI